MLYESDRLRLSVSDGIATLWLGDEATRNTLGLALLRELDDAISAAQRAPVIDVLVIRSGIAGVFAGGPNLDELANLDDTESRLEYAATGQHVLRRLADLSTQMQTVAVIEGRCADAGLELALACSHRLAVASAESIFVCDAVRHGVPPGWGGTVRLPQTVGLSAALNMLAGAPIPARAAQRLGLVDRVVGARQARTELLWYLAELQDLPHRKPRRQGAPKWWQRLRESPVFSASIVKHARQTCGGDPIVHATLETAAFAWREGSAEGMAKERRSFATVIDSAESMRRQARARRIERYFRHGAGTLPSRIVVIGSDEAGIDLAVLALQSGVPVTIPESVPAARQRGEALLRQRVAESTAAGWFNALEIDARLKSVFADVRRFEEGDLVLIASKAAQGGAALLDLESTLPVDAVLASLAAMPNLTASFAQPQRCLSVYLSSGIAVGEIAELRPLPVTASPPLALVARWLRRAGLYLHDAPASTIDPARQPAVFAA